MTHALLLATPWLLLAFACVALSRARYQLRRLRGGTIRRRTPVHRLGPLPRLRTEYVPDAVERPWNLEGER